MTPAWFTRNIAIEATRHTIDVEGAAIAWRRWSNTGKPGLLFVHGHGANSHWWDFIAPAFMETHDVIAMDMSGSGDSDHREIYQATTFANEIIGVCDDAGLKAPVIVGHSFGGAMTRITAWLHPEKLDAIVLIDSAIAPHRGQRTPPRAPRSSKIRHYPTLKEGARRFRLRPPQPCGNRYIVDHIARHSLRESEAGWYFKLDQSLFSKMREDPEVDLPDAATMIRETRIPVGFIYGGNSRFFPPAAVARLQELIEPDRLICIPGAWHHVFLDQPERFTEALSSLLERLPIVAGPP